MTSNSLALYISPGHCHLSRHCGTDQRTSALELNQHGEEHTYRGQVRSQDLSEPVNAHRLWMGQSLYNPVGKDVETLQDVLLHTIDVVGMGEGAVVVEVFEVEAGIETSARSRLHSCRM